MNIRKEEWPFALLMSLYLYLVITTFWILKPIKKSLFIRYYDQDPLVLWGMLLSAPRAELVAKVLNVLVALGAVVAFSKLSHRFRRERLTFIFSAFFIATYVLYAALLRDPGEITVWSFYLYGDLYSTLMVATFFAFLNDSVSPEASRRLYGMVVLGGVVGGVTGPLASKLFIGDSPASSLWLCLAMGVLIMIFAWLAGRRVAPDEPDAPASSSRDRSAGESRALEGAKLVFRSRYLLAIVAIVGLYEIVSTVMDFQFTSTIAHYLDGPAIGQQFSTVFTITNAVSLVVQLFLTGYVMSRFRLTVALSVLPLAAMFGSATFLVVPGLWIGSLLNTIDNGFSYSINQSAKEALYTPTTRNEKYRAKAFIDMFVQRVAKSIAVIASLGITAVFSDFSDVRWLSLVTIALVIVWIGAVRYAGHRFHALSGGPSDSSR